MEECVYAQESLTHERSVLPDVTPFCLSGKSFKRERERERSLGFCFSASTPRRLLSRSCDSCFCSFGS